MPELAIVIPAYKINFFGKVLKSLANQTCKEFTLYVGNDGSKDDFKGLLESYQGKINIVYKYFSENLGRENLVSQWDRCIDMVQDEEWIWLFSDDDFVDNNCVELFYKTKKEQHNIDLYHFNVALVNERDDVIRSDFNDFPKYLDTELFLLGILKQQYHCTVVEFIFRKSTFFRSGRFQSFDLAWCSDISTWIKIGNSNGILNIPNAVVYWRSSQLNISCSHNIDTLKRQFNAQIEFAKWICDFLPISSMELQLLALKNHLIFWLIQNVKDRAVFLSSKVCSDSIHNIYRSMYDEEPPKSIILSVHAFKIYKNALSTQGMLRRKVKSLF